MAYRNYSPASGFIVDSTGNGDFTTIAAALTAATSGTTIFIKPGTYTQDLTLKAGVNLTAFTDDGLTPNVTIVGNATMSVAGTVSISGIRLQTNSAAFLTVSGSVASIVNLDYCYLNCTNATGVSFTSSSSSSQINIKNCKGDLGATLIGLYTHSSSGNISINSSTFSNSGGSSTASTCSSGRVNAILSTFNFPITFSSTASGTIDECIINSSLQNATALTISNSANPVVEWTRIVSGTASAVSVSGNVTLTNCTIDSTNTNAITGSGTVKYSGLTFYNSVTNNVTTQNSSCGTLQGSTTTAPSAGFLGERITSSATSVSLSNLIAANITSISLTPGIWDISGIASFTSSTNVLTLAELGISTTSATFNGTTGDQTILYNSTVANINVIGLTIPAFRAVVTSTTTYFLVGELAFSSGTGSVNGRISGVRVG